jgi:hypothetical protein
VFSPSITSDQEDYNPGATVTLSGAGWGLGETVQIIVNDDKQQPWSYSTDVTAAAGNFTVQFQLPTSFAATYSVQATGASGAVATTTFTDGNINIKAVGPTSASVSWARFSNGSCQTGTGQPIASGSISAIDSGNGTAIPSGAGAGQSLRLTAGSPTGFTFASWSSGNFTPANDPSTANPVCLVGDNNTQNIRLNYTAAPADTAPPAGVSISINAGAAWTNSSTGTVTVGLSATDNVGVTRFRLAETQAGLGTAGDVAVSPAEATFSRSGVSFTLTGAQAASKTVWLRVCDAANNCTEASDTIGWDKTAPTVAYTSASPAANGAGWNNTDVIATFTATDSLSGFAPLGNLTKTDTSTTSGQGSAVTVGSPAFTDLAGNTAAAGAATSVAFKIDKTAPTITFDSQTPAANGAGWNNSDVTVKWNCADTLSGPASAFVTDVRSAEGTANASGTCTDNAGNSASATREVKIDKTDPTITFDSQTPAANANGWNNTDVTVKWLCADTLSGPLNAFVTDLRSAEGAANASGTCTDKAGNTKSATREVKIDKTDPVVTCPAVPTFLQSQLPQTITASVTDALSQPVSTTAIGTADSPSGGTVSVTGQDKAGNSKTVSCTYHVGNTTFLAPVDKAPIMNLAKLGRVVPVKTNLVYDGAAVTGTGTVYVGGVSKVDCASGTGGDEIEVYAAGASNTGNLFRWDGGGFWMYNFDTSAFKMILGNCYRINVFYGGSAIGGTASGGALVGYFLLQTK